MDWAGSKAGTAGTQARVYGASQFRHCHRPPVARREIHAVQSACAETVGRGLSGNIVAKCPVASRPLSANI